MATTLTPDHRPPSLPQLLREAGALVTLRWRSLLVPPSVNAGAGQGLPVLVIPGFLASDYSTVILRRALRAAGHRAYGWGLGLNMGARRDLLDRIESQLHRAHRRGKVTLVGWSLGGLYARELAKRHPDKVAKVITLGSPFSGDIRANNAWRLYEMLNDHRVDSPPIEARLSEKPPVPTIAFWSRRDGIVAPACARGQPDECDRSVELNCTHMGFMSEACAIEAVLKTLQDE